MLKYHIQTIEAGSGGTASFVFSNIPSSYTDLYILLSLRTNRNATYDDFRIVLNSTNGTSRILYGDGTNRGAFTQPTILTSGGAAGNNTTANTFGNSSVYISDYASTTRFKAISMDGVQEHNATTAYQSINAGFWSSTAAVTEVTVLPGDGTLLLQYSSASLYGIRRGSDGRTEVASGGTITTSGGYTYHTFTTSGTFVANRNLQVDTLVIAGGGGGGGQNGGGGGGAGGHLLTSGAVLTSGSYAVGVGSGGARGGGFFQPGANGGNSFISTSVAFGGGGGGCSNVGGNAHFGRAGGSGGGAGNDNGGVGGASLAGQGNAGGSNNAGNFPGGGGGGAGAAGQNSVGAQNSRAGGIGTNAYSTWATATSTGDSGYYCGGAASGANVTGGGALITSRTLGGGGGSANDVAQAPANTGGGGGGFSYAGGADTYPGGNGGSGVVIIRYLTPAS